MTRLLTERIPGELRQQKRGTAFNCGRISLLSSRASTASCISKQRAHAPDSSQSRVYAEAAYSFSKRGADGKLQSDEYLNTRWAVHLDDLPVERLFDETSDRAEHLLECSSSPRPASIPSSWMPRCSPCFSTTTSASFPRPTRTTGCRSSSKAMSSSRARPATCSRSGWIPRWASAPDTTAVSEQGVMQRPLTLVERNPA